MSWNEGPTIHPTSQEELNDPGVNVIRENLQTSITYPEYIPNIYLIYIYLVYINVSINVTVWGTHYSSNIKGGAVWSNVIRENLQTSITYPEYIPNIYLIYISGTYQVYTYHMCATHIVASLSYMYILKTYMDTCHRIVYLVMVHALVYSW